MFSSRPATYSGSRVSPSPPRCRRWQSPWSCLYFHNRPTLWHPPHCCQKIGLSVYFVQADAIRHPHAQRILVGFWRIGIILDQIRRVLLPAVIHEAQTFDSGKRSCLQIQHADSVSFLKRYIGSLVPSPFTAMYSGSRSSDGGITWPSALPRRTPFRQQFLGGKAFKAGGLPQFRPAHR